MTSRERVDFFISAASYGIIEEKATLNYHLHYRVI